MFKLLPFENEMLQNMSYNDKYSQIISISQFHFNDTA